MGFKSILRKFGVRRRGAGVRPEHPLPYKEKNPIYLKLVEILKELKILVYIWIALLVILVGIDLIPWNKSGFLGNLLAEFHGLLLDVLVFGLLIVIYDRIVLERRRKIALYVDEIDVLRDLKGEDVTHKIIAFVKKLDGLGFKGIDLMDCNLEKAIFNKLSLENAKFSGAVLNEATFSFANIQGARFSDAKLKNVTLVAVQGGNARFCETDLTNAIMEDCRITDSYFGMVKLTGARLSGSDFQSSNFECAGFQRATIYQTDFQDAVLEGADLTESTLDTVGFKNANLSGADFRNATMKQTPFNWGTYFVYFTGADLEGVNFEGADLHGADLIGAKNLTIEQLSKAKSLYQTKLDPELEQQIREKYPYLLEKPKDNSDGS